MKKRVWITILAVSLGILAAAGTAAAVLLPVTYRIDSSLIVKNPDYDVFAEERDGYTTLVKKDASGKAIDADFKVIGFTDTHLDHHRDRGNVTMEYIVRKNRTWSYWSGTISRPVSMPGAPDSSAR